MSQTSSARSKTQKRGIRPYDKFWTSQDRESAEHCNSWLPTTATRVDVSDSSLDACCRDQDSPERAGGNLSGGLEWRSLGGCPRVYLPKQAIGPKV